MNFFLTNRITVTLLLTLMLGAGCDHSSTPPPPLAVEQIPNSLQEAFASAKPDTKEAANQIVAALQVPDYSKAFLALQTLATKPELNKKQQSVISRSLLTVNTLLQSAPAKGDEKATQTLNTYRRNK
jgi:hypothetical protein